MSKVLLPTLVAAALVLPACKDPDGGVQLPGQPVDMPAPDDDPEQAQPPVFTLLANTGFEVTLGMSYDRVSGELGDLCRSGEVAFQSNPDGRIGGNLSSAEDVLFTLGANDDEAFGEVGLGHDPSLQSFAQKLAAAQDRSLSSFANLTLRAGALVQTAFPGDGGFGDCAGEYVASVGIGASFLYALKLEFAAADDRLAFAEDYGAGDFMAQLDDEDLEQAEDWFVSHPATVSIFVAQLGTMPVDLSELARSSRCSTEELEGCFALRNALADALQEFSDNLGEPTADGLAGWAETTLSLERVAR